MQWRQERGRQSFRIALSLLALTIATTAAFAKNQPKIYSEEGKVIGTGTSESLRVTYKVETDLRIYKLECDKSPRPGLTRNTPRGCGGPKGIEIGDVIHLRKETPWVFIPIPDNANPTSEQRLRILSEEAKPSAGATDKPVSTAPDKQRPH